MAEEHEGRRDSHRIVGPLLGPVRRLLLLGMGIRKVVRGRSVWRAIALDSPAYWKARSRFLGARQRGLIFAHRAASGRANRKERNSILRALLRPVVPWVGVSCAAALVLLFVEQHLFASAVSLPEWLPLRSSIAEAVRRLHSDASSLITMFSIAAQVAGVLLGLYFATFGIIMSGAYAEIEESVRNLLISERVSNAYVRWLVSLLVTSILLLGFASAGIAPGLLNLLQVVVLAILASSGFVSLAKWLYRLFSPIPLVSFLIRRLHRAARQVSIGHLGSMNYAFQSYHQRQAQQDLGLLSSITSHVASQGLTASSGLAYLGRQALAAFVLYSEIKGKIPVQSNWFRRKPVQKPWATADYHEIRLSVEAGRHLAPQLVPDYVWFESQLADVIGTCLDHMIRLGCFSEAAALYASCAYAVKDVAGALSVGEGVLLISRLRSSISQLIDSPRAGATDEEAWKLEILGSHTLLMANLLLGLADSITAQTGVEIEMLSEPRAWASAKHLLVSGLPPAAIRDLWDLHEKLSFEKQVERHIETPPWYVRMLLGRTLTYHVGNALHEVSAAIADDQIGCLERVVASGDHLAACHFAQGVLQTLSKAEGCISRSREPTDHLAASCGTSEALPDWEELETARRNHEIRALQLLGQAASQLQPQVSDSLFPDYIGQAYSYLVHHSYSAVLALDGARFELLFPLVMALLDKMVLQIRQQIAAGLVPEIAVLDPITDAMDVSGYATLMASAYPVEFLEKAVGSQWEPVLADPDRLDQITEWILPALRVEDSPFQATPRNLHRVQWRLDIAKKLREDGVLSEDIEWAYGSLGAEASREHQDPLVRVYCRTSMIGVPNAAGIDVFYATRLAAPLMGQREHVPERFLGFSESLEKETERESQA